MDYIESINYCAFISYLEQCIEDVSVDIDKWKFHWAEIVALQSKLEVYRDLQDELFNTIKSL